MSAGGATAALPRRLGRYEVQALLGRGAMGSVYRARDPALDRHVAVKTLGALVLEAGEHREEYLERFQREARAAARLSHPNVVAVHDLGVDEETGAPFIVMELVPGVSLATLLRENPLLPVEQALEIAGQVAAALEEAHRHGIVHRDVKPGNVFVDPRGRVKVGDFGIARVLGSELTQTGVTLGTPGYLAPEVVRGGPADARADVFALGALAYALLAGRKPFLGVTPHVLTQEVLDRHPDPPHVVRPEVPLAASQVVMRALAKSPETRTPTAAAFRQELVGGAAADLPATASGAAGTERVATAAAGEPSPTMTVAAAAPRRRVPMVAMALALLLAAMILAWLAGSRGGASKEAPAEAASAPAAVPVPASPRATAAGPARPAPRVAQPPPQDREPERPAHAGRDKPGKGRGQARGHAKQKKG